MQVLAATKSWDFSTSSDYTFDNTKIEFSGGQTQLKATSSPTWYNTSWTKRKVVTINNTGNSSTLTNYQVQVAVTYDSDMKTDFSDIRFTDSDGVTLVGYWLETKIDSTSATFWVKVPSISGSSSGTIYMYYGNSSATSAISGANTFDFFDDFSSGAGNWTASSGTWSVGGISGTTNPVFTSTGGQHAENPELYKENGIYYLYYSGKDGSGVWNIHLATSTDLINWTEVGQELAKSSSGWDSGGVWSPAIIKIGSVYHMYYDAFDSSQGSVFAATTNWKIGMATSSAITGPWIKDNSNPVLSVNPSGWDSVHVYDHTVTNIGGVYYMYYTGSDGGFSYRKTGIATSSDGYTWSKYGSNPILNDNIEALKAFTYNGVYYLISDEFNTTKNIYLYYSTDGITYVRHPASPILTSDPSIPWENSSIVNAYLLVDGNTAQVIYQGNSFSDSVNFGLAQGSLLNLALNTNFSLQKYGSLSTTKQYDVSVSSGNGLAYTTSYSHSGDIVYEARVNTGSTRKVALVFNRVNSSQHYEFLYDASLTPNFYFGKNNDGDTGWTTLTSISGSQLTANTYYDFKVTINSGQLKGYVNGNLILSTTDSLYTSGNIGLRHWSSGTAAFTNTRVRQFTSVEPTTSLGSESNLYSSDNPTIQPLSAVAFSSISGFSETATKNSGEIKYQLSNDGGTTWYWYNSGWTTTVSGYTEASTASQINSTGMGV